MDDQTRKRGPQHTEPILSLSEETRPRVPTHAAAHYLGLRPRTLHRWHCKGNGPLQPVRVHGRLLWPVADIKRVLGVA